MTDAPEAEDHDDRWKHPAPTRVAPLAVVGANGATYRPGQVIVRGSDAVDRLMALSRELGWELASPEPLRGSEFALFSGVPEPEAAIAALGAEGHHAQVNHVFWADACGADPCGPHPSVMTHALDADPLRAHPLRAHPLRAHPLRAHPLRAHPLRAHETSNNTAVPAPGRELPERPGGEPEARPRILVLDSGLAHGPERPVLLGALVKGDDEDPDGPITDAQGTQYDKDDYLDPVAGHGTFIAGLIEQLVPGCEITVARVFGSLGDVDEAALHQAVQQRLLGASGTLHVDAEVVCLSFGGPVAMRPAVLEHALALIEMTGAVIVASAGNWGTCVPHYPAAAPGVIGVAALGPDGPAPWTNYGDWVDACAPGTDLVSAFFAQFDGAYPMRNTVDVDRFGGWAVWSGTSFAAPVVVAALARSMMHDEEDGRAARAVERVIEAPHLLRLPCLGTVVNL